MATRKKKTAKWEYLGETDPAQFIHSKKTHRTVSEAFRDADYATAFWRQRTDLEELVSFVEQALLGVMWVGVVAGIVGAVVYWLIFS